MDCQPMDHDDADDYLFYLKYISSFSITNNRDGFFSVIARYYFYY